MKFEQLLIGLLVFSLVVVTGVLWIVDTNAYYNKWGVNIDTSLYTSDYNQTRQLGQIAGAGDSQVSGQGATDNPQNSMIRGGYSAILLVKNSYSIIGNILHSISTTLGVPDYFIGAAMTAIIITVIFTIVYLVMGKTFGT